MLRETKLRCDRTYGVSGEIRRILSAATRPSSAAKRMMMSNLTAPFGLSEEVRGPSRYLVGTELETSH